MKTNHGVILEPLAPTDFIAGGISGITYEVLNPTGNWVNYLPTDEMQVFKYFDSMACVSFSAINSLETQINFKYKNGLLPQGLVNWLKTNGYFDQNDKVNFSDRFIAKLSGTTTNGNSINKVWDTIRHFGLVPEKDWPAGVDFFWGTYYSEIPQEIKNKGLEFLKWFDIKYEWVSNPSSSTATLEQIKTQLKQAPLQLASSTCPPWNTTNIIASCDQGVNHATLIYNISDHIDDFDHYNPYKKNLALDYHLPYLMKGIVEHKTFETTCEQARFIYMLRPDVAKAFPALNKFVSLEDPSYDIYQWVREYGIYELPDVFVNHILDYSLVDKGREAEAAQLQPEVKKKISWLKNLINKIKQWIKS